jgi:hypothetical protein
VDAEAGAPQYDDQAAQLATVHAVAAAQDGHALLDRGRVRGIEPLARATRIRAARESAKRCPHDDRREERPVAWKRAARRALPPSAAAAVRRRAVRVSAREHTLRPGSQMGPKSRPENSGANLWRNRARLTETGISGGARSTFRECVSAATSTSRHCSGPGLEVASGNCPICDAR